MKRLNINLYDDEYAFLQAQSKARRLSMNKIIQFWIRDLIKHQSGVKSVPVNKEEVDSYTVEKDDTKVTPKEESRFSDRPKEGYKFVSYLGKYVKM